MCKRLTKTFPKAGNQHKEEPLRLEELGQYFGHQNLPWQVRPNSMFTNHELSKKFCLFFFFYKNSSNPNLHIRCVRYWHWSSFHSTFCPGNDLRMIYLVIFLIWVNLTLSHRGMAKWMTMLLKILRSKMICTDTGPISRRWIRL